VLVERDLTAHLGLGIQWMPMSLGGGISYFQELSLGYFTSGTSFSRTALFTQGARAGIEVCGVKTAIGYAGRWHNDSEGAYPLLRFPWETFQLTLNRDWKGSTNLDTSKITEDVPHTAFVKQCKQKCKLKSRRTRLKTETATFRLPLSSVFVAGRGTLSQNPMCRQCAHK